MIFGDLTQAIRLEEDGPRQICALSTRIYALGSS